MNNLSTTGNISKDEAVRLLNANGYTAVYDKGLVRVQWVNDHTFKEVSKLLKAHNYNKSFGVCNLNGTDAVYKTAIIEKVDGSSTLEPSEPDI